MSYSSHDSYVIYAESEALAVLGDNHCFVSGIDKQALDQRIAFIEHDCPDSVLPGVNEVVELDLLHNSEACSHQNALVFVEILEVDDCGNAFTVLHLGKNSLDVDSLSDLLAFRQLPNLKAIGFSVVGNEEDVVM